MPLSAEIIKKIKRIHIKTNFLTSELFTGEYESAFKGAGIAFEEVREYVPGDDVRFIDWNVTARTGKPHLKLFRQEHERTLILMVDSSASMTFGGREGSKRELAAEIAAVLAYAAVKSNDKVGLLMFSETVECFIPPKKGRSHVWRVIQEMLACVPRERKTNIENAITCLRQMVKRRAICIVISDFLQNDVVKPLERLRSKHDVVALRIVDPRERDWPDLGLLPVRDLELQGTRWVNTASPRLMTAYQKFFDREHDAFITDFRRAGIDAVELQVGSDYVHSLMSLFRRRERKRS